MMWPAADCVPRPVLFLSSVQNFAMPVVEMQLAKGGIRLAHVLNSLFASSALKKYTVPRAEFLKNELAEAEAAAAALHKQRPSIALA